MIIENTHYIHDIVLETIETAYYSIMHNIYIYIYIYILSQLHDLCIFVC